MWLTTALFSELQKRARWKVEFFCGDSASKPETAFDAVPLREVFEERREFLDPQVYPDHVFNYLGLEHVQSLTGDLVDFRPQPGKEILSRCKVFRRGDVLYGRLRPYLNKVFLACGQVSEGICSGEFYVLTPETSIVLPHFALDSSFKVRSTCRSGIAYGVGFAAAATGRSAGDRSSVAADRPGRPSRSS